MSSLDDPDMDLAENSHASTKSRRIFFSLSTGNSTNRSVNTKQFAIGHKSCTLKLAIENKKWVAQLEFENKDMSRQLQELEAMLASGLTTTIPPTTTPAPPARWSIRIAGAESANSAGEGQEFGNTSPNVTNKSMVNNDLPIPIHGGGGTTQYQPSTDNDDPGSDLPLSYQGGGFTSHYHSPQRTANELPSLEDTAVLGRRDKSQQSMPPVHTFPNILPLREVYIPFPVSSGKSSNTYYPCPERMSAQDQVQPIPGFDPKTQKQVLCTIWRPTTWTIQVFLKSIPRATLTQAKK